MFAKKHNHHRHTICNISKALWQENADAIQFTIVGNRFLRGMVRSLVATLLQVGRGYITCSDFERICNGDETQLIRFDAPAEGLYLMQVKYLYVL